MASIEKMPKNALEMPHFCNIAGAVGHGQRNHRSDVILVSYLLNNYEVNKSLQFLSLPRDHKGHFGRETSERLKAFGSIEGSLASDFGIVKPVSERADLADPAHSNSLLARLNAWVYKNNPMALAPDRLRKEVPDIRFVEDKWILSRP